MGYFLVAISILTSVSHCPSAITELVLQPY